MPAETIRIRHPQAANDIRSPENEMSPRRSKSIVVPFPFSLTVVPNFSGFSFSPFHPGLVYISSWPFLSPLKFAPLLIFSEISCVILFQCPCGLLFASFSLHFLPVSLHFPYFLLFIPFLSSSHLFFYSSPLLCFLLAHPLFLPAS